MSNIAKETEEIYRQLEQSAKLEFQHFQGLCTSHTDLAKAGAEPLLQHKFKFLGNEIAITAFAKAVGKNNLALFTINNLTHDHAVQFVWHGRSFVFELTVEQQADLTDAQSLLLALAKESETQGSPLYGIPGIVDHFVSSVAVREKWDDVLQLLTPYAESRMSTP